MSTLKKVADKLTTSKVDQCDASGTYVSSSCTTDAHIVDAHHSTVQTGEIISQKQVGTVDVIETTQQIKKVPVVETTRQVETLNTGLAAVDIHSHQHQHLEAHHHDHHALHTDLPHTHDAKTVVVQPVVEETVRKDRLVEVQPVIHKEVEKEVVHHVVKHINEAPAPSLSGVVTLAPVVQEHVHTHVIEEVHPVIHREIAVQEVERVEEHITEHVVAPTKHVHEVIVETQVLPAHVHDHHCHHKVSTEVIHPVSNLTSATVTTREALVDCAGPSVTTAHTQEIVGDKHLLSSSESHSKIVSVDAHTDAHLHRDAHLHTDTHLHPAHSERYVETTIIEDDAHKKAHHHHHLHLPHFLHRHKKESDVIVEEKHSAAALPPVLASSPVAPLEVDSNHSMSAIDLSKPSDPNWNSWSSSSSSSDAKAISSSTSSSSVESCDSKKIENTATHATASTGDFCDAKKKEQFLEYDQTKKYSETL